MSEDLKYDVEHLIYYWSNVRENLSITKGNMGVNDIDEFILEKYNTFDICFRENLLNKLDEDNRKNLAKLLTELKGILKNVIHGRDHQGDILIIEKDSQDLLKEKLNKIYDILLLIPSIDVYLSLYQDIYRPLSENLEEDIKKYEKEYQNLFGKLTQGSLHYTYEQEYDNFKKSVTKKIRIYYGLLAILFIIIVLSIGGITTSSSFEFCWFIVDFSVLNQGAFYEVFFKKAMLIMPLLWAILFISGQIKEDKKLEQAYLHKMVVTKSYVNTMDYFDKHHSNNAEEVKENLSKVMVESLGLNPALLLEKNTAEQIPAESLTLKIFDKLPVSSASSKDKKE